MISNQRIIIPYGSLFPWQFRFVGGIVMLVGLTLIFDKAILAIVLLMAGGLIVFSYEGTVIDKAAKTYQEYNSFFFIKTGERVKYAGIEKIFINSIKQKRRMYTAHTNHSSTFESLAFSSFLKFNDGTKIELLKKSDKSALVRTLKEIAAFLDTPLEDKTS